MKKLILILCVIACSASAQKIGKSYTLTGSSEAPRISKFGSIIKDNKYYCDNECSGYPIDHRCVREDPQHKMLREIKEELKAIRKELEEFKKGNYFPKINPVDPGMSPKIDPKLFPSLGHTLIPTGK